MFPSKSPQPWLVGPRKGRALEGADHRLATAAVFLCAHFLRAGKAMIMATKFPKGVKTPPVYIAIYRDGKFVRNIKMNDPRRNVVRLMNQVGHGLHAVAVAKPLRKGVA
jgi:hypothetical protein